ncbi:MAG TPA: rod shape-determining protein MreC, partial [Burkholderiales bacterium]|nr:rod shape-determining protein MreC [Burkholderiales bacterium]
MEHQPRPFFKTGPTPLTRLLIFSVLSLALLGFDSRLRYLDSVREAVATALYPLQQAAHAPGRLVDRVADFFVTQAGLQEENARLSRQHVEDAAALLRSQALEAENVELRALLKMRRRIDVGAQLVSIAYTERDPFSRRIFIDHGARNGIRAGQVVIDSIGVVGQIIRVHPWTSEVALITDKDQTVPVEDVRTGTRGVVFGMGYDGAVELRFMPFNTAIRKDDRLVTSGIGGTYPPGLPVADVISVERNAGYMFARITCRPLAGVNRHRHLLVLSWAKTQPPRPPEAAERGSAASKKRR